MRAQVNYDHLHEEPDEECVDEVSRANFEFHYEKRKEQRKTWDKFVTNDQGSVSASEKKRKSIKKQSVILKLLTIVVTFSITLICGLVSKGALFLIVAQVNPDKKQYAYCNEYQDGGKIPIAWLWSLFFAFSSPEMFTFVKSARIYMMRKTHWPSMKHFSVVCLFETLHTSGLALLFFLVMPHLDSLRAMILTNGVLFWPCLLSALKGNSRMLFRALDLGALLLQVGGLVALPVLQAAFGNTESLSNHLPWALPLGLFLCSFGWWESFVDEKSKGFLQHLWRLKINMIEGGTRYPTYLFVSLWKIILFFCLLISFVKLVSFISFPKRTIKAFVFITGIGG